MLCCLAGPLAALFLKLGYVCVRSSVPHIHQARRRNSEVRRSETCRGSNSTGTTTGIFDPRGKVRRHTSCAQTARAVQQNSTGELSRSDSPRRRPIRGASLYRRGQLNLRGVHARSSRSERCANVVDALFGWISLPDADFLSISKRCCLMRPRNE